LPVNIRELLPSNAELVCISYYALSAALLTAVPAAVTGILQAGAVMNKTGDIYLEDKKTLKPKVKTLFTHAALSDTVILISTYYWWTRRKAGGASYEPETWMMLLSFLLSVVLLFAASFGATLVYRHGAGMAVGKERKHS
jgi:uncharacterized membrane protein